jgi:integrase
MRIAELCSLKWKDIDLEHGVIHVHSQQLVDRETGEYFYANWTKNEKGTPNGGRYIPIFDETREIILEYRDAFNKTGIKSEWVFANEDGSWIKVDSQYAQFLRRISSKCGCQMSNNHAIRIYFNSFVLIPAGVSLPNRARILGHTEEVNLSHYTFEEHDYVWTTYEKVTKYRRNAGLSARGD